MTETKDVRERRSLSFHAMDDILADAEALAATGDVRTSGNWTPGQNLQHVARFIRCSVEGFSGSMPWPFRVIGRLLRGRILRMTFRPGLKVPAKFDELRPDDDVPLEQGLDDLRAMVALAKERKMTAPSPILGELSHDEWEQLHCRHAEMHFSFLHPASAGD